MKGTLPTFFSMLFNARERSLFMFLAPHVLKKVKLLVGSVFWEKLIDGKSFRWLWDA